MISSVPAVLLGDQLARAAPLKAIRLGLGMLFVLVGLVVAVNALRLV
jgi:putative Ca2+/H+ antiporter (TMEM165/GDT1 family)